MNKLRAIDIELAVARHFNHRINVMVPNVYWFFGYELDLIIISRAMYATEIEIKTSVQDIKNDLNKSPKAHRDKRIKFFYYAVPDYLINCEYLPTDAGLISVDVNKFCRIIRPARINKNARKLYDYELTHILHLGCMRLWNLKTKLLLLDRKRSNNEGERCFS